MKKIFTLLAIVVIALGCQKGLSNETQLSIPIITTTAASAINSNSVLSGGNITSDGGDSVIYRGVCWDTLHNPIRTNSHTSDGAGIGTFFSSLSGLQPATTYYIRAYAVNSTGTAYGNEENFTTSSSVVNLPTLNTTAISELFSTTAKSGGIITDNGGAAINSRGLTWSITTAPTIASPTKTTDGVGTGTFISNMTGLTSNTTYYVRAYATNSAGAAYGNEKSFTTPPYTVYVAGAEDNGSSREVTLWRNGSATVLSSGPASGAANSVFVVGSDVYVAGETDNGKAVVWKNGVATVLNSFPNNNGYANSVFVSGNDVYAVGDESVGSIFAGTVWKNGIGSVVNNSVQNAFPRSVYVVGNDVYVAGYEYNITNTQAKLWKNGVAMVLGGVTQNADAFSVFVSGINIYVAGYEYNGANNVAMLWKNGVATVLGNGTRDTYAQSVYVVGNDIYVAGYKSNLTNNVAMLWKNGVPTVLSSGTNNAYAYSVFVFGSDVYVAGQESTKATVWKNGVATVLSGSSNYGIANSVFVK